jgi:hypothetical protein
VFEVRCHKCEAGSSSDGGGWLANLLEHTMQLFEEQQSAMHGTARDHGKFNLR